MSRLIFNFLISAIQIGIRLSFLIELLFEGLHLVFILFSLIFESTDIIFNLRLRHRFLSKRAWIELLLRT
jgi:hypothetical protein